MITRSVSSTSGYLNTFTCAIERTRHGYRTPIRKLYAKEQGIHIIPNANQKYLITEPLFLSEQ